MTSTVPLTQYSKLYELYVTLQERNKILERERSDQRRKASHLEEQLAYANGEIVRLQSKLKKKIEIEAVFGGRG